MTKYFQQIGASALLIGSALLAWPQGLMNGVTIDPSTDGQDRAGFHTKWDAAEDRFILFRDTNAPERPAVRLFSQNGDSSVAFYPLRDFPAAQFLNIRDAAATPEGGIVIAGLMGYGPYKVRGVPLKSLFLTYDSSGHLTKVWNVAPYDPSLIAVDSTDDVFALGEKDRTAAYPLLVKYSPDGKVLSKLLYTSLLPKGTDIQGASRNGESELFIKQDKLFVWLAPTEELFRYSLNGDLESRISLGSYLQRLTTGSGSWRLRIENLAVLAGNDMMLQVQFWPPKSPPPPGSVTYGFVRVSADGSSGTLLATPSNSFAHRFLGTSADDKLVFLELQPDKSGILKAYSTGKM